MNESGLQEFCNIQFTYNELCLLSKACHEMQVHSKCIMVATSSMQDRKTYENALQEYTGYKSLAYIFDSFIFDSKEERSVADEETELGEIQ